MDYTFKGVDLTPEGKKFFAQLKKLAEMEVAVGYQSGEESYDDGTDLCAVAAYNEYGSSDTPARPFMKQSFENHESELKKACERVHKTVSTGGSLEKALDELGVFCKGLVQDEIVEGSFAPNAESTVSKKGSAQPLIDTGLMRQSVNYVVRKRT